MTSEPSSDVDLETPEGLDRLAESLALAASDPTFGPDVAEIVEKRLRSAPVTPDTFGILRDQLLEVLGADAAMILLMALSSVDEEYQNVMDSFARLGEPDATELTTMVKRTRARYKSELSQAFEIWLENPDDWRTVNTDTAYSLTRGEMTMAVTIETFGGETFTLKISPSSSAKLAGHFIDRLSELPDDYQFADLEKVHTLLTAAELFREKFGAVVEEAGFSDS
jgi:hypothetical protein